MKQKNAINLFKNKQGNSQLSIFNSQFSTLNFNTMPKTALITGINGQDGSYLAEFLLDKGYNVHGIIRRSSTFNTQKIEHLYIDDLIEDMHKTAR